MGFSRQGYWSGLSCPPLQGIFPTQDQTHVSCIGRWVLYHCASWKALTSSYLTLTRLWFLKLLYFKELIQSREVLYPWTVWGPLLIFWNSVPGCCFGVSSMTPSGSGWVPDLSSQTPLTLCVCGPGTRTDRRVRMEELSFLFPPLPSACVWRSVSILSLPFSFLSHVICVDEC